ncbi:hypothetical protein ABZS71_15195 [Streptomyces sp. NPDC005393]|uniref:hypothetical protein n=1 Tax=Streptomyces sp. NPDC005393 TaxID=3157041 RepID=UPI0033B44D0A
MWVVAEAAGQLGTRDARADAQHLVRRPAVVALSTERLSMTGPGGLRAEDLGPRVHFRYRSSGLRLLLERGSRYYLLPLGWNHRTDPTYVMEDDDSVRIELLPVTQRRR